MKVVYAQVPELVTIPNVPLVQVGLEYQLSTGPATFTEDDLRAAVAAVDDPGIRQPGVKFGHNKAQLTQQPRIARINNLRYDESDMTVYGDIVGLPRWIADIMPVAYPDRSIEGMYGLVSGTGRQHQFVIEDLALLGEDAPGVSTLDDLYELFYGDGSYFTDGKVAAVMKGDTVAKKVAATVEVEDVRRAYYDSLDTSQMWWWIRAIRLDPNELIVDDDEGGLYRVPFTISGEEISFGEAQPVKIVYEDVAQVAATMGAPLAVYASRAESRPEITATREEEPSVDELKLIREKLGLPEDASTEDILARLDANGEPTDPNTPKPQEPARSADEPPAQPVQPDPDAVPGKQTPDQQNSVPNVPEGMVVMDAAALEELQIAARRGAAVADERDKEQRDAFLGQAVKAGKFPRSRVQHYAAMWDKDPEGTRQFIDSLAAGTIPVAERGTSENGDATDTVAAYPTHWFPEVQARKQAIASGTYTRPRVQFAQEG